MGVILKSTARDRLRIGDGKNGRLPAAYPQSLPGRNAAVQPRPFTIGTVR
jgi:hypothetical protein